MLLGSDRQKEHADLWERPIAGFLNDLPDGLYILDRDWRFVFINAAAGHAWDREPAALIGKPIWESFPQALGSESYRMHYEAANEGRTITFETHSMILDHWISMSARSIDGGLSVAFRAIDTPGKRGRILLVDDEEDVRDTLQVLLEDEGYLLSLADNFHVAEAAIRFLPVDLLLVDDRLPGGRGSTLVEQALEQGLTVLVMSGDPSSIRQLNDERNFIAKPFGNRELLRKLAILLRQSLPA